MSMKGRFERLLRQVRALVNAQGNTCHVCLRSRQTAKLVEVYDEGDEYHTCSACGHPITATGEPIGYVESDGMWRGKLVVLEAEEDDESDEIPEQARTAQEQPKNSQNQQGGLPTTSGLPRSTGRPYFHGP